MALAGARIVDDRRRRRLALESESDGSGPAPTPGAISDSSEVTGTERERLVLPMQNLVPLPLWKTWCLGGVGIVAFMGLLLAWLLAEEASQAGSPLGTLIAPLADRMLCGMGAATWFIAGELACVVWWGRSRSRFDYGGRFHSWGWVSGGFCLAALCCLTNAHRFGAHLLAWSTESIVTPSSAGFLAAWLLPCLATGLALWATTASELRDCLGSRLLHSLAAVLALSLVGLEFWSLRAGMSLQNEFAMRVLLSALQWSNLMTLLLHVRHVVHVSADPPADAPSWLEQGWDRTLGRMLNAVGGWLRRRLSSLASRLPEANSEDVESNRRRIHLDTTDEAREVRIDDAEAATKGPSRRTKQAARAS